MGFRNTKYSKSQWYRRQKRAALLGCGVDQLPDNRGKNPRAKGPDSPHWRGPAKMLSEHGYVKLRIGEGHPLADPNGYAYEHLVVWCAAGNPRPGPGLTLHHKNEDKTDNRLSNLQLLPRAAHNSHHIKERGHRSNGQFRSNDEAAGRLLDGVLHDAFPQTQQPPALERAKEIGE